MPTDIGHEEVSAEIRRIRLQNRWVIAGVSFILPTVIGIYANFARDIIVLDVFLFWSIICLLLVLQVAFVAVVLNADPHALYLFQKNVTLADRNRTLEDRLARYERLHRTATVARSALTSALTVAGVSVRNGLRDREALVEAIEDTLDPIVESGDDLIGFDRGELWSFALYVPDRPADRLTGLWRRKARGHPGSDLGRPWKLGVGHVGITFTTAATTIIPDMTAPDVPASIRYPHSHQKAYDGDAYRSLAAFPVMFGDEGPPIAVLAVTSDRPGRLTETTCLVLRECLPILAILLSAHYDEDSFSASDS